MKNKTTLSLSLILASLCLGGCGEKHTHDFTNKADKEEYLASATTCTSAATYYYSCECGEKGTETYSSGTALGHEKSNSIQKDGNKHWDTCKRCGTKIDEVDHSYGDLITDTAATCSAKGSGHRVCSVCSNSKTEEIEKTSHDKKTEWSKNETQHWHDCNGTCGEKFDTVDHTFGDLIIDTPATCTTKGSGHRVCSTCNYSKPEEINIDSTAHNYVEEVTKQASNTEMGVKTYTCSYCQNSYTEAIPHTGSHRFNKTYVAKDESIHCRICEIDGCDALESNTYYHTFTKEIIDREPDGENPGHKHKECNVCGYHQASSEKDFTATLVENINISTKLPVIGSAVSVNLESTSGVVFDEEHLFIRFKDNDEDLASDYVLTSSDVGKTLKYIFYLNTDDNHYFRLDETGKPLITCKVNNIDVTCPATYNYKMGNYWYFEFEYEIPECVHDWQLTNEIAPTDSSMGENTYVCNKCGNEKKEPVAHTGEHKLIKKQYSATKHTTGCSIDGCTYTRGYSSATECNYRLKVDKAPDGENKGVIRHVCRVCNGIKNYEPEEVDVIYIDSFDLENFSFVKKNQTPFGFSYDFNPGMIDVLSNKLYVNNAEVKSGQTVSEGTKLCWKTYFKCKEGFAISPSLIGKSLDMYIYSNELCRYKLVITQTTYEGQDCYLINPTFIVGMPVRA